MSKTQFSSKLKRARRWIKAQAGEKDYWISSRENDEENYRRIAQIMSDSSPYNNQDIVLDVGCGPGGLLQKVTAGRVIGIDPLASFFTKEFMHPYQNAVSSVGEAIPLKPASVTKMFCCNALDHTLNPQIVLKEISSVLNEQGILLLTCTAYTSPDKLFQKLKEHSRIFRYDPHPSFFTIDDIRKLLSVCGFTIIKIERISPPRSVDSESTITRLLDKLGSRNSGMMVFVAKKQS